MTPHTPLSHLTDEELLVHTASVNEATDLELELAFRLEAALDELHATKTHTTRVSDIVLHDVS